ncbi:hypothetical protein HYT95_02950, partial [Candidatus Peregrinibacteria bacterium]|nr:hypothetical protein [Candidatus Peregrinibacteria bacterium]
MKIEEDIARGDDVVGIVKLQAPLGTVKIQKKIVHCALPLTTRRKKPAAVCRVTRKTRTGQRPCKMSTLEGILDRPEDRYRLTDKRVIEQIYLSPHIDRETPCTEN